MTAYEFLHNKHKDSLSEFPDVETIPDDSRFLTTNGIVVKWLNEFAEFELNKFKKSAHYKRLLKREAWLTCLESAGVDNWSGYDHAIDIRDEYNDDNT